MTFLIIETFHKGQAKAIYQRFDQKGRMLPDGVRYINSWIDEAVTVCYQIMESDSREKIVEWTKHWNDLAEFEIIPVIDSEEAKRRLNLK